MSATIILRQVLVRPGRCRHAFTLIELLVVTVVILILASIAMKTMSLVTRKTGIANTTRRLEMVKHALAGYYARYGAYPPNDLVASFGGGSGQVTYIETPDAVESTYSGITNSGETLGLVYYLTVDDPPWSHYLEGLIQSGYLLVTNARYDLGTVPPFSNRTTTIEDGWGNPIGYWCTSQTQYQVYRLWSSGLNTNDPRDDIDVTVFE